MSSGRIRKSGLASQRTREWNPEIVQSNVYGNNIGITRFLFCAQLDFLPRLERSIGGHFGHMRTP